jgi:hypothetical protein
MLGGFGQEVLDDFAAIPKWRLDGNFFLKAAIGMPLSG